MNRDEFARMIGVSGLTRTAMEGVFGADRIRCLPDEVRDLLGLQLIDAGLRSEARSMDAFAAVRAQVARNLEIAELHALEDGTAKCEPPINPSAGDTGPGLQPTDEQRQRILADAEQGINTMLSGVVPEARISLTAIAPVPARHPLRHYAAPAAQAVTLVTLAGVLFLVFHRKG